MIPLLIFFTVFVAVTIRALHPSARDEQQRAVRLPLEHDDE